MVRDIFLCPINVVSIPGYVKSADTCGGVQHIFRFDNDYGARVYRYEHTLGFKEGLWELAVLHFDDDEYELCYTTDITDDVVGYCDEEIIKNLLDAIRCYRGDNSKGAISMTNSENTPTIERTNHIVKFDSCAGQWTNNNDYNRAYLKSQAMFWNDVIRVRGHVFLNEIFDSIGISRTPQGQLQGWLDTGSTIEFYTIEEHPNNTMTLHFGETSVIWDKI